MAFPSTPHQEPEFTRNTSNWIMDWDVQSFCSKTKEYNFLFLNKELLCRFKKAQTHQLAYMPFFACFLSLRRTKRVSKALSDPCLGRGMQGGTPTVQLQNLWVFLLDDHQVNTASPQVNTGSRELSTATPEVNTATSEGLLGPIPTIEGTQEEDQGIDLGNLSPSYEVSSTPLSWVSLVYKVVKALYGLHQAPRAWYDTLATYLLSNGFQRGKIDQTLFIKSQKGHILLVQIYVDDIIFGSTKKELCDEFEKLMKDKFQMSSMGELTFFLGLQVQQKKKGIFISQDKYVHEILRKFNYTDVKSASTPTDLERPLVKDADADDVDEHLYRSMIGSLMYLTASRPDIMFAVCACARFQVSPKTSHLLAVKRIFRYLKGKPSLGLWYSKDSPLELVAYTDSDYAGATLDRKSTTGGCQFLGNRLISWQCKKQTVVATSTTEAEYVAAASCCGQVLWIQNQLLDYGYNFMNTVIYIDNTSTICIIENPVQHSKTKHIEIRHHFIRDCNTKKLIQMAKIDTQLNVADLLTKGFDAGRFQYLVSTYASYMGFTVYQMDVKSAFLYGQIEEEVYVCQPPGFEDPDHPDKVYKVVKALYGLHQAPRAWYDTLATYLLSNGFQRGKIDQTLFIKSQKGHILLVQIYVDDIIFGSTKKELCDEFEKLMKDKFQMSSMGELTFFLGLQVQQKKKGIFISQDKYVHEILKKFNYTDVKSASTPTDLEKPLVKDADADDVDEHLYRSMIGSLMYLTASRPDIMFAVCACARFQVSPKTSHLLAVKRIFRYLKGKPSLGLWYSKDSPLELVAYTDSDYAGATLDRKSTTGGCQFLGNRLISWQCKKQTVVATSTTEAEYVAAASCCGQVLWIQNQLLDYGYNFMNTVIYIDNTSTICIIENPVQHSKTKHIEIRHHFIRDCNTKKLIQMAKIDTQLNVADLLTKGFDAGRFQYLVSSIGMLNL
ncbi:putative ribonuclease H-like domain-containing protein [Tanacetum coccineum]